MALVLGAVPALAQELPALRIDPTQITTSGISSGAYMAVQFGVAHSATVSGVAATAGGPYFCAGRDARGGMAVGRVIARCMQGDPAMPAVPIGRAEQAEMAAATRAWAAQGRIDPLAALAEQRVWLFHGYNDGIVKRPVVEALRDWYGQFVPAGQVFFRNDLRAAHAQISASCAASGQEGAQCNPCAQAGGNFINTCADPATGAERYDAAGAALQWFYGPLEGRVETSGLSGSVVAFDQRPYVRRDYLPLPALRAALAETGYAYVPAACAAGEACRLHVAFHGCQQQAERIGLDFVRGAGFNEWADANRIVVLYPQATATRAVPITPLNPQGCWDWWGYNDFLFDAPGRYATREGLQVSAVWRMVERLRAGGDAPLAAEPAAELMLRLADVTAEAAALTWAPVPGAASYRIEREEVEGAAAAHVFHVSAPPVADHGLAPERAYRYVLHALDAGGAPIGAAAALQVRTARAAPACDPYYSLADDRPVDARGRPAGAPCP
ncbi:extracellular catalytic domain type 2 short-chain-length polyhydroxyalkanoate depolymerase [Pseudothauera nasutitermitis]|uniref:extracellular catalytic domain type 2 short-chain-length polyhydroxyalkanoate depolymerase n=1 Tax=Pseudothauera nasutitermitis TaxID=2565930 RepID=UPI001454D9BC|nr:PHB depolymerase family esterase [Pseudothauera nasutitermitis]